MMISSFIFFVTPTQLQVFYFELGTYNEYLSNLIYLKTYNIFHHRELLIFLCLLITRNTLPLRLSLDFADINQHRFSNKVMVKKINCKNQTKLV